MNPEENINTNPQIKDGALRAFRLVNQRNKKKSMKRIYITFLIFCCTLKVFGKSYPDSVVTKYNSFSTQKEKEEYLFNYMEHLLYAKNIKHVNELSEAFSKQKEQVGADFTMLLVCRKLSGQGELNYVEALNRALPILHRFEERNDTLGMAYSLLSISYCYGYSRNYEQAIVYLKKSLLLANHLGKPKLLVQIHNDIGSYYSSISMPDSGLVYGHKAVALASKLKARINMPYVLSTVAENYIANKDYDLALPFLRRAIVYAIEDSNKLAQGFLYNDYTLAFIGTANYDSAFYYVRKAINVYTAADSKAGLSQSYKYLSDCFEKTNQIDSSNKYFRLSVVAEESLYKAEKTKLLESMTFTEQLRRQELENERAKSAEEREHTIQYALIAVGIISFLILFLLLSRSMITNTRVITFLSVLALLIVFEFLNLLLHPFLERVTNHSPLLMLLALVCIAALLIPLHHKLEKWTTNKLVEKNKAIRLMNAKKTIEQLEKNIANPNQDSTNA